ncbi:MAG: hypothetical protein HQL76_17450 [Magnetococcales bacterium]|nr:hypothetical protein [Magnetococcales bacterium]
MGNTIAFDTHAYIKKLREAGVDERQAEIQAEALVELVEDRLATKRDVLDLKRDLREIDAKAETRFKELDTRAETRFKELDTRAETRLKELDTKAETRLKELDTKLETKLKELELRMVLKMGGMILAGIGILFGLMRAWPLPVQFAPVAPQEIRQTVPQSLPGK